MTTAATLTIDKLSKRYPGAKTYALRELSLRVAAGEVYGFLGANGAGKSTTIRALLNFIQPTSGSAVIMGYDSVRDSQAAKRHIGYLAGEVALYEAMTGREFLEYMAALQPPKHGGTLAALVRRFDVSLDQPIRQLSKGNRQKIGLIQAFMHEPDLLVLDEPTSGLDPLMQEAFFELVSQCKSRGAAVFVSSHNFTEAQRMCDRVGFIHDGRLVAEQSLAEMADRAAHTLSLTFAGKAPLDELERLPNARVTAHNGQSLTVSVTGELSPLFAVLGRHHVTRLHQQEIDLEEQFMRYYRSGHGG